MNKVDVEEFGYLQDFTRLLVKDLKSFIVI